MKTLQRLSYGLAPRTHGAMQGYWLAVAVLMQFCGSMDAAPPSLESLSPPVASRGGVVELRATGSSLGQCDRAMLLREGIECLSLRSEEDESATLQLKIREDCPLGFHPIRLHAPGGISELRFLCVSPFPVTVMAPGADARAVRSNQTIVNTMSGNQVDRYHILAKQGEIVSAEVVAVRLGIKLLDTELTVYHPDGNIACHVDDTPLLNQDPCFSIRAEQSGEYTIDVRAVGSSADAGSPYAIHLGYFPRPAYVFPAAGACGSVLETSLFGLDPQSEPIETLQVTLPELEDASDVSVELVRREFDGAQTPCPSPIAMRSTPFATWSGEPSVSEPAIVPVAFHGKIDRDAQIETYSVQVPENALWVAEVFAESLGSRLDACLEVYEAESNRCIARGDDFNSHDARIVFMARADRTYQLRIYDKRSQSSPWHSYRIEVRRLTPSLVSFLPRRDKLSQNGQALSVPRGNRSLAIMAIQRNRIVGTAVLDWQGLPPHVQVHSPSWQGEEFALPVVLDAASQATEEGVWVQPVPRTESTRGSFTQVVDLVRGPADAIYCASTSDRLGMAITPPVPYRIELIPPANPLPIGGTLELRVRVHREAGFRQPLEVSLPILPEFVDAPAKVRIEADQNEGIISLRSFERARPQQWPLVVEAVVAPQGAQETKGAPGAIDIAPTASAPLDSPAVCSELCWLDIQSCPVSSRVEAIAAEQGHDMVLDTTIEGAMEMTHPWTAQLEGLPNRVTAEPEVLEPGDRTLRFVVHIADDAPTGTFDSLQIRLHGTLHDQSLTYCLAPRTRLVITRPGEAQRDEQGRPLSRLEALRKARTNQP
jgi:hypothetical protein